MIPAVAWKFIGAAALAALILFGLHQWKGRAVDVGIAETKAAEQTGKIERIQVITKKREQVKREAQDNRNEVDKLSASNIADEFLRDYSRSSN